jgi:hypothetical protein
MQIRFGSQDADPLLFTSLQLLQASDDLPHIRAGGQCRAAVMGGTTEDEGRCR